MTARADDVVVGDVWTDKDPRGGPTFVVLAFTNDGEHAWVANVHGAERRRKVKVARIPKHYELKENVHGLR